ncbi:plasmid stabilization protein [Roseivirga spongicola]|jgi:toxin ParE1/3/4|uniref:Toxin n=1 Tax=Roseivirga spongicola TaxID=333140 RepID=A0A150XEW1_9BACT|nr:MULTISPECIES: type II toxin-antitoxin system RelE/ParE family toxin [Roseivirga]KYG77243.1 plasmid stabilization protein [Roseivirga spongicola]MBO6662670.1 type II toxin-antitoxin system RelE/ParE family toxin [Roseivirga sp.]MBO6759797.1 type II toxin-antitoxin system RelE/ParE family toxin [Roseivirga sp.]MBO6909677.1 type II toxin-antitoxin system RelE/ParE family toxin [Roseivirga sp.]|tara:strand:+ start:474 stop:773 length:300 start_codon:yes stop_codon:yes gene_type:complete
MSLKRYVLSVPADQDLEDIFDYTKQEFGEKQAVEYLIELEELFIQLLANPELGRERNEIKQDLRSMVKNAHVVFYHIMDDHIRVVRVLHGSRDMPNFLE